MLEMQIASENRSFQTLSVIGANVGLLYWIDKTWLETNAARIFGLEDYEHEPSTAYGWAAWNAFLIWVRPHSEYFSLFRTQFAYAIQQASNLVAVPGGREGPMYRLGEHLVILYGRGELKLDEDFKLLQRFLTRAALDVRRHTISFIGYSLKGEESLPPEIISRFIELWEWYWRESGRRDAKEMPNKSLFGPWFISGQFPKQWSIDQLAQVTEVALLPEPDNGIVERLAEIASTNIAQALSILDIMARNDVGGWHTSMWLDSVEKILRLALDADSDTEKRATDLTNFLGKRGFTALGKLL